MQEKHQHFDKKFTDRAWGEMAKLLDAEMPAAAAQSKRRAIWWWLMLALGLGLSAGLIWYFGKRAVQPAKVLEPIANTQPDDRKGAPAQNQESAKTNPSQPFQKEEKITPAQGKETSHAGTVSVTPALKVSPGITSPGKAADQIKMPAVLPVYAASPPASAQSAGASAAAIAAVPVISNTVTEQAATANKNNPDFLEKPALEAFGIPAPAAPGFKTAPFHVSKKSSGIAVYAGAMTTPFAKGDGITAGFLADVKLNSRLSFETGLGYSFIRQPLSILLTRKDVTTGSPVNELDSGEFNYAFTDLKSQAEGSANNYLLASQDLALHYLDMPVSLQIRANTRWSFYTGFNLSLLLASAPDFTRGGVIVENSGNYEADDVFNAQSESSFSVPVSTLEAAAVAGLRYHLSRKLSLGLQYQMGLTDVIRSNNKSDNNRLFRLSAVYRLK